MTTAFVLGGGGLLIANAASGPASATVTIEPSSVIVSDSITVACFGCAVCWDLNVDIVRADDLIQLAPLPA